MLLLWTLKQVTEPFSSQLTSPQINQCTCVPQRRKEVASELFLLDLTSVDHKGVIFRPKRPDIHEVGRSTGCLSFYCKGDHHHGKDPSVIGCNAKEPSTIKLQFTMHFDDRDPVVLISDPFRVQGSVFI